MEWVVQVLEAVVVKVEMSMFNVPKELHWLGIVHLVIGDT